MNNEQMKYKLCRPQGARLANDCRLSVWLSEGLANIAEDSVEHRIAIVQR